MTPKEKAFELVNHGAMLTLDPKIIPGVFGLFPVGAITVINGAFIWAELFAGDQHQIHAVAPVELRQKGETMVEIWSRNSLYGVLEAMDSDDAKKYQFAKWLTFKNGPEFATWDRFFQECADDLKQTLFEK
jgi:hypothetical protein